MGRLLEVDREQIPSLDFCYLTTKGRRSGGPHTIEIWFALQGDTVYLLAGGGDASDCAGLVEAAGGRVRVVEGDPRLVKITTAFDLAFVETLLANE